MTSALHNLGMLILTLLYFSIHIKEDYLIVMMVVVVVVVVVNLVTMDGNPSNIDLVSLFLSIGLREY